MTVKVKNFGCRLNALEGDYIRAAADEAGLADTTIINSCAVTHEAVRQAGQAARKAKRNAPSGQVIVTGCAAQTDPDRFAAMAEIDRVIGNAEKLHPATYRQSGHLVGDIMALGTATPLLAIPLPAPPQPGRARALVQVQTGCNHRCTFCAIPHGRGNSRSVPVARVVANCRALVADGHKEIVLTGVDITAYGGDIGEAGLGALVRAILDGVADLPRLRLSSIDAVEIDPKLLDMVIHEPRLMPHLHLSLQAGDNMILKRMKRRHSREQAIAFCQKLKAARPDITFGADLIAGFPTETDAMFENSLALIDDCDLTWLHVFAYSARPDTPAAKMPQTDPARIKARAALLRTAGRHAQQRWMDRQIGRTVSVLVEKSGQGRCENFARVRVAHALAPNSLVGLRVTGHDGLMLEGDIVGDIVGDGR